MLKGFLNHGSVIVHDLLLGTSTRIHTVSFPARRARSRRSAGHKLTVGIVFFPKCEDFCEDFCNDRHCSSIFTCNAYCKYYSIARTTYCILPSHDTLNVALLPENCISPVHAVS